MTLPLDEVKVIDADTHMTERHDLWTSRAPASRSRTACRTSRDVDGVARWVVDGDDRARPRRAPAASSTSTATRAGRSKACTSGRSTRAPRAAYDPVARDASCMDEIGIWAQIVFPGVVGLGGQSLGERRARRRAAQRLPRDLQRRERRAPGRVGQPAAADGDPARVGHRRVRARSAARARARPARREPHVGPAGPRLARPRRAARGIRCGTRARRWSMPVHFHIGASLTTMSFFGNVPVGLARRRHEARDRRHAAVHRQRARRRQHHLLGDARPLPRAQDRVGRERRRLDPVHPRGARLRDGRERAAG